MEADSGPLAFKILLTSREDAPTGYRSREGDALGESFSLRLGPAGQWVVTRHGGLA